MRSMFLQKGNPIFSIKLGYRLPKLLSLCHVKNSRFFFSYFLKKKKTIGLRHTLAQGCRLSPNLICNLLQSLLMSSIKSSISTLEKIWKISSHPRCEPSEIWIIHTTFFYSNSIVLSSYWIPNSKCKNKIYSGWR